MVGRELVALGDGVSAWLVRLDRPPVNSLSRQLIEQLAAAVAACQASATTDGSSGLIVTGSGRFFSAGAEISEFKAARQQGHGVTDSLPLIPLIHQLEAYPLPTVALISGYALGGGCELAMGAHYRVAVGADVQWGLPEIHLGLLPAATGTQRLPRLVGVDQALRIMLDGTPLPAARGLELGVFDALVDTPEAGLAACRRLLLAGRPPLLRRRSVAHALADDTVRSELARVGQARAREAACQAIVACVRAAHLPYDDGLAVEAAQSDALMRNSESPALQYLFFAQRAAAKLSPPALTPAKAERVHSVGIVGAGLMGTGIAVAFASAGHPVTVVDDSAEACAASQRTAETLLRGRRRAATVSYDSQLQRLADVDLVIEAVYEDIDIKTALFARLDSVCKPTAFLCSNTSALDIDAMAAATRRPERVMGLHFFSPAHVMPLLEAVRGQRTSPGTLATLMQLARSINKIAVLVGNCRGFVGNRLFARYVAAAEQLVLGGLTPAQVDAAAEQWGMKMGPFAVQDLVGLDLRHRQRVKAGVADAARDIFDALVESGRLGQKNGRGFYLYDEKDSRRRRAEDPQVVELVRAVAARLGVAQCHAADELSPDRIGVQLHLELINEAFLVLDEGMAQRPSDIDVVMVFGYGAPRWRGGPLFFAEHQLGFANCLAQLRARGVTPAPLLVELVASNLSLEQFWHNRQSAHHARL